MRLSAVLFIAASASAAAAAHAAPASPEPEWLRQPTVEELTKIWPAAALAARQGGLAEIECKATPSGQLSECKGDTLGGSAPAFAKAAEALAPYVAKRPKSHDGKFSDKAGVVFRFTYAADGSPQILFPKVTESDWVKRPTADDISVVWPKTAWAKGIGGTATVACKVTTFGRLTDCKVDEEDPAGEGFGSAAILLTPQMLLRPATVDGQPVEGTVHVPVRFLWQGGPGGGPSGGKTMARATMIWTRAPTVQEVAAAYPAKAREARINGAATLQCSLSRTGALQGCSVIRETPGYGFGAAARSLTRLFQSPTVDTEGKSVGGIVVHLPFSFTPQMLEPDARVTGKPEWMALPSAESTKAAFGDLAGKAGATRVTLECTVLQRGFLDACTAIREEPAGMGVGDRALTLTKEFRLSTWSEEGLPTVGGRIRIPLRYEPQQAETAASK